MNRILLTATVFGAIVGGGFALAQSPAPSADDHAAHHPAKAPKAAASGEQSGAGQTGMGNGMMGNGMMGGGMCSNRRCCPRGHLTNQLGNASWASAGPGRVALLRDLVCYSGSSPRRGRRSLVEAGRSAIL